MKKTIDSYIGTHPAKEKKILEELRRTIHTVGSFEECIKYNMPAFQYHGKIVACFRIYTHHIGFYPYSGTILGPLSAQLKKFKTSIGAVQFPKEEKLPKQIIKIIIKARMKEIDEGKKRV